MMIWDPVDYPYHRSLCAKTLRISSTWPSHGYGLLSITYSMTILPCSLCMICSLLCLCHALVTHALHYTWWLILVLICVFASLVETLLVLAMFLLCTIPMVTLSSCFVFVLAICHVHCPCLLFAHMTWLLWTHLVCCIFAPLVCMTWSLCLLMLHHPWFILAHFMRLMTPITLHMIVIASWHISPCVASLMLDDFPCIECNNDFSLANEIAPIAFLHIFGDLTYFLLNMLVLPLCTIYLVPWI